MKVKNISEKVIGVAGNVVMPDNEITVSAVCDTPGLRALESRGMIQITEDVAAEVEAPKKRTRKAKNTETEEVPEEETTEE